MSRWFAWLDRKWHLRCWHIRSSDRSAVQSVLTGHDVRWSSVEHIKSMLGLEERSPYLWKLVSPCDVGTGIWLLQSRCNSPGLNDPNSPPTVSVLSWVSFLWTSFHFHGYQEIGSTLAIFSIFINMTKNSVIYNHKMFSTPNNIYKQRKTRSLIH